MTNQTASLDMADIARIQPRSAAGWTANKPAPVSADASQSYRHVLAWAVGSIGPELQAVEKLIASGLRVPEHQVQSMLDHVKELGGKRLRPSLMILAAKACGRVTEETIRLAASVELVHTATLVHDDLIDRATVRRHQRTLHTIYGPHASVLVGDWLFTHAYELANGGDSTVPGRWIAQAAKDVCEGEILQGLGEGDFDISVADHVRVLSKKTGALCRVACSLGAWSAGSNDSVCLQFGEFGSQLGTAFQIYDDWLDLWGTQDRAGKTLGTDIENFKPTIPTLRAIYQSFQGEMRLEVVERLKRKDPVVVPLIVTAAHNSDAGPYTLEYARSVGQSASNCLETYVGDSSFDQRALTGLIRLAAAATNREG
jgi:octaprenyl-diphosphate synthase